MLSALIIGICIGFCLGELVFTAILIVFTIAHEE